MEEKGIELIDYLQVIWKKKWLIMFGTFLCMIVACVVSFLVKPIYEIDTIIQPGMFLAQNQAGNFEEIIVEDPQQIADKVSQKSYDAIIAGKLNIDVKEMPEIKN
jgi:LPS O-antigen subunit length determinant protein (WzzB/FepE family)